MDTPYICNLNALNESQKDRYKELTGILYESRQAVKELNDGYAFRFKAESQLILDMAEFIVYERLCCPLFIFELIVESDTNRMWLSLRGQNGIKEFIRSEFRLEN
ncbi:MAG TPA: hypothetical protein VF556_03200 [Pyrinomonadaceae bacterium]|jgi:hypothetical protein